VYDSTGALKQYLDEKGFVPAQQFAAFIVWNRNSK
jgi:hypothetical protein